MAKNLNYNANGSKCYNDEPANCNIYGRLYDWVTAMAFPSDCNDNSCIPQVSAKHQGICPSGWHIPSNAEWTTLIDFVGGEETAGKLLKATSGWNSSPIGDGNGQDTYGFSALPGGSGNYYVGFGDNVGEEGTWWSSSAIDSYDVHTLLMEYSNRFASSSYCSIGCLISIRCLRN